ncbi:sulfotransferase [Acidimangrovimonas pyrenivorans]|uniref:Sulfotransferase n=1 Tax=Acidimangrovimonas pyrenivorans TaxID=2030798 RepID=A0ABV7ALW8_9RHOB
MISLRDDAPVIIFGMHRSGTTVLGNILEAHGMFGGVRKDENGESVFFQLLNDWMMTTSGARWDVPEAIAYMLEDPVTRALTQDYLRRVLKSPQMMRYFGVRSMFGWSAPQRGRYRAWGWKDPRNTFTLPIWETLFPNARFVYVERHGVDVAKSLLVRRAKELSAARTKFERFGPVYGLRLKKGGFSDSVRCSTLENAFSLWEAYVAQGRAHANRLGPEKAFTVQFEKLCAAPRETVGALLRFLGLGDFDSVSLPSIERLKPGRANAYLKDPVLSAFAEAKAQRLSDPLARNA